MGFGRPQRQMQLLFFFVPSYTTVIIERMVIFMKKVYVAMVHDRLDDSCEDYIDSIWTKKKDAKQRIKDLVYKFIEDRWYYDCECDIALFNMLNIEEIWNDEKTIVKIILSKWEEIVYCIDEINLNTVDK